MSSIFIVMKMLARLRIQVVMIVITLFMIVMGVVGAIIVSSNTLNYASAKLSEKLREHLTITIDEISPSSYSIHKEFFENITSFYSKVYSLEEVENVSLIATVESNIPGVVLEINKVSRSESPLIGPLADLGVIYYPNNLILINGSLEGLVLSNKSFEVLNKILNASLGDEIVLRIIDQTRNETLYQLTLPITGIYSLNTGLNLTSFPFTSSVEGSVVGYALPAKKLDELLNIVFNRYGNSPTWYIMIRYRISIELKKEYLPLYNPDAALKAINEFKDKVNEIALESLGYKVKPSVKSFGFITIQEYKEEEITTPNGTVRVASNIGSPVENLIGTVRNIGQFQMAQSIFNTVIPLFIGAWFLLSTIGALIVDYLRRGIALLYMRGVKVSLIKKSYIVLIVTVFILASIASVPVGVVLSNFIVSYFYDRLYYEASLFDISSLISSIVIAVAMSIFVIRSVGKLFREDIDLTLITRVYAPLKRDRWKPSTILIIFVIISVIKYIMWALGISSADLFLYASRSGMPVLIILALIYGLIDFIAALVAPYVLTYFVVMYITHNGRVLSLLGRFISRIVSGRYHSEVIQIISKGSYRLYKTAFIIALILAIMIQYIGLGSSYASWYPHVKSVYREILGVYALIMEYTLEGTMYAYKTMVSYGVGLAVLSTILVALVVTKDLEKELTVLRARGGGRRDLVKILYGVVFTIAVVSVIVGFGMGLIWLRGVMMDQARGLATAVSTGPSTNTTSTQQIPEPAIVFTAYDVAYILIVLTSLFVTPLITIFLWFRKPVVEKLRGVLV